jgi:hypothetical protein
MFVRRTGNATCIELPMRTRPARLTPIIAAVMLLATSATACTATVRPRAGIVYVRERPPARVLEVRGLAPARNYVWISGQHEWRGNTYVWVPGRYAVPAAGFRHWQDGQWKHDRNGWYWVDGHWR